MTSAPDEPTADDVDPEKLSTPAGVAGEIEEEAAEEGATTDGSKPAIDG